jgi:hypothetical protein
MTNATAETEQTWRAVIVKDGRESKIRVFGFDYFAARAKIESRSHC